MIKKRIRSILNSHDLIKLYNILILKDFNKVKEFINDYGLEAVDKDGNNVFLYCVSDKTFNMLAKKMIEQIKDLNINFQNKTGNSALHIAVTNKDMDLLELLLKNKNIKIDISDCNGDTPLTKALFLFDKRFDEDIVIKLLDCGADINKFDKYGYRLNEYIKSMNKVKNFIKENEIIII